MAGIEWLSSLKDEDEGFLKNLLSCELEEIAREGRGRFRERIETALAPFGSHSGIAVTVAEESDSADGFLEQIDRLLGAGAKTVWAVYPVSESVMVFEQDCVRRRRRHETLDAPTVLPGFQLALEELFKRQ